MTNILFLLLLYIYFLSPATAQNKPKHISTDLFNSLEELSRLVDISYCVGTTGVHQPFQCLSHCTDFPDLELLTVSPSPTLSTPQTNYIPRLGTPAPSSQTHAAT
jgi:triacylglycerol lipase